MTDSDDEALSWAGDEDRPSAPAPTPGTATAAAPPVPKPTLGQSALLVIYGVFAGVGVLYSLAWLFTSIKFGSFGLFSDPLQAGMATFGRWLAVLAPALWALAVFALLRDRGASVKLTWLLLGAIVLVPWPWLMGMR